VVGAGVSSTRARVGWSTHLYRTQSKAATRSDCSPWKCSAINSYLGAKACVAREGERVKEAPELTAGRGSFRSTSRRSLLPSLDHIANPRARLAHLAVPAPRRVEVDDGRRRAAVDVSLGVQRNVHQLRRRDLLNGALALWEQRLGRLRLGRGRRHVREKQHAQADESERRTRRRERGAS